MKDFIFIIGTIHVNQKAKDVEEICQIIKDSLNEYPTAHWEL